MAEARTVAALNHPNIVTVYEAGVSDTVEYIAMEYIDGLRLDRLISRGRIPIFDVLKYAEQIAKALAKAHALGVIHRDLQPGNVVISSNDVAKVLDFGLAKCSSAVAYRKEASSPACDSSWRGGFTLSGAIMGMPSYMSPEQARG